MIKELAPFWLVGAFVTFFIVVRVWSRKLRAGQLKAGDWNDAGVFFFGLLMAAIWPLTWVWMVARLESKRERLTRERKAAVVNAPKTERKAQALGVGLIDVDGSDVEY